MPPSANVLTRKLRHGGVARSPLAETDLLGETFARGVEDRMRLLVKTLIGTAVAAARVSKLADATSTITGPAILGLVDVEDADTPGLIALESDLAYHLIDLTLGGDPSLAPEAACPALHRHRHGARPPAPRRDPRRLRPCDRREPRAAADQGPDHPRPAPEPLAAPPRARLHRRARPRHGPYPRRGRAERALPPDPAALCARRDPRLDPGPQPPGGEGPAERPVEDADAPCRGQRHGAGRRRPPSPVAEPRRAPVAPGRADPRDPAPGRRGDPSWRSPSPAAAPRCSPRAGSAPTRTTR